MGDLAENAHLGDSGVIELTGKIMVVAIVLLLFIIAFVFCIHLYAKWFWYRRQENPTTTTTSRRRRRLDFASGHQEIVVIPATRGGGLELSALKTIPVITYSPKEFKDGLECAVCLSEVSEGEKARILPKCNHGFHVDCIDMWFQSHCTCPLCRNSVSDQTQASPCSFATILEAPRAGYSSESANFPTNVLIWGDETTVSTLAPEQHHHHHQVSSNNEPSTSSSSSTQSPMAAASSSSVRPGAALAIEIPRQIVEDEEQKSPIPTRLRSLKRLLSGSSRRLNPSSPRNLDLEQG